MLSFFFENYNQNKEKYPDKYPPLIVFLDINMPLVNGFEFLDGFENLRIKYNIQSSIIMMFTSSEREEDKEMAFSHEFVKSYLLKGQFSTEDLGNEIKKVL